MTKATKIIRLSAENVKRLHAVEIEPSGAVVRITGKNGAGKSSVLDAIWMALGGEKAIPRRPVRKGEAEAVIELELEDLTITRRIKPDGKSTLVVAGANGARFPSPQTMLNKLVGGLSFDPLAFARMGPAEQRGVLREIVGLDTSEIEADRAALFGGRTVVNRETKRLEGELSGVTRHPEAPPEEVDIGALTEELDAANRYSLDCVKAAGEVKGCRARLDQAEAHDVDLQGRLEALDEDRKRVKADLASRLARIETETTELLARIKRGAEVVVPERKTELTEARDAADALAKDAPNVDAIRARLASAEDTNAQVRHNARHAAIKKRHVAEKKKSKGLTKAIDKLDQEKAAAIAGAEYPLEGLTVDDEGVLLGGLPLEQASSAEQLRCSIAIGLALNPQLRVLLVRDGSLLDEDSMRLLTEAAAAADAQVWLEVVGDGSDGVGIVIEDGSVKAPQ